MISGKKILLGICGSIAAYKSAFLVRLLVKEGAEVKVIMTEAAKEFITPLSLSTLSGNPVLSTFSEDDSWNNHVELGLWADAFVIAPASANTLAKFANGLCDNLLSATYLSAKCPVFFAPAMDLDMWKHPATQNNIGQLERYGNKLIPVAHGELASGLVGEGRMAEPEEILSTLDRFFSGEKKSPKENQSLRGKHVLVTAGPTVEPIDPVRYISNHSTGKMGIALANQLSEQGAKVTLVIGPTNQKVENENITTVRVMTAEEMHQAAIKAFKKSDIAILAAAVSDFTPEKVAHQKIKKNGKALELKLKKTKDILLELSKKKKTNQLLIGFALETDNEIKHAKEKLESKDLDMIVLNSLREEGAGFGHDTNKITILDKKGHHKDFPLKSKQAVARDIIDEIVNLING